MAGKLENDAEDRLRPDCGYWAICAAEDAIYITAHRSNQFFIL